METINDFFSKHKYTELKYNKYKKYEVEPESIGFSSRGIFELENTIDHKFVFKNGYGASVIKHIGTYGSEDDLFELAVIKKETNSNKYHLCYPTPIADDVIGYLTNNEVLELLERIKNLKEG
jgi:hypothetical protein